MSHVCFPGPPERRYLVRTSCAKFELSTSTRGRGDKRIPENKYVAQTDATIRLFSLGIEFFGHFEDLAGIHGISLGEGCDLLFGRAGPGLVIVDLLTKRLAP